MTSETVHRIVVISDGTGETAAQMVKAALVQFSEVSAHTVQLLRHKNVRNETQIRAILDEAKAQKELIVFTLVSPQLRSLLINFTREHNIPSIDLLGPLLTGLSGYFGNAPKSIAGLLHDVNEDYFKRIEAMEYTLAHDDGRDTSGLEKADIIILGVSRTSKTPLSMYLGMQGWKVCNIPLILGFELPREVLDADQRRVVGLTIHSETLVQIRRARLERLGQEQGADYADPTRIDRELNYSAELFRRNKRWPVFNVTGKALEETAAEIIKVMSARRLMPTHLRQG